MVAVLQALKEVVAGEGLTVTPTSLFAAVMSALEKSETQASAQVSRTRAGSWAGWIGER